MLLNVVKGEEKTPQGEIEPTRTKGENLEVAFRVCKKKGVDVSTKKRQSMRGTDAKA